MLSEKEISQFWEDNNVFERSLEKTKECPEFVFYDGPPFATGLPHYGHLVASTIKDIIPRYMTQMGRHVKRQFGFDCHGLPIEFKIEEMLGIKTKQEILEYGIENYNGKCRGIVMKYRDEWETVMKQLGRWVDMENDYKTMDLSFMNSVWWVFKQLYNKGRIYRGYKVCPYSMGCGTPLSNFEAKSNYKDVHDWSLTVQFTNIADSSIFLAWTTTPWTLPTNMLLCVNPTLDYVYVEFEEKIYILAKSCLERVFKKKPVKILQTVKGQYLVGSRYRPLFKYYESFSKRGAFKIVADEYVGENDGTGIVHCSPAHGDDDYRVFMKEGIIPKTEMPPCPLDEHCNFTEPINQWNGRNVKEAENDIVKFLSVNQHLFRKEKQVHSYPYCWRSETPLIYKVCESWFIDVISLKPDLLKNNQTVNWTPGHIGENRFHNWLDGASDWCVSRNRFWGTPMPIWANADFSEVVCVGCVEELEVLANLEKGSVQDLHRDKIDHIRIPSKTKPGEWLTRVEFVFDCWFESGSMPYAQWGYSGEGEPPKVADFIAEGLDQTRGWFYTLLVIGTALYNRTPYKNVIVNGIVLNEKGEKMSKSKGNFPPVSEVLDEYGADALRLYLIDTQVVKAGDLRFRKKELRKVIRQYHMMLNNVMKYYFEMVDLFGKDYRIYPIETLSKDSVTVLDNWILQCLNDLYEKVHSNMKQYKLNGLAKYFMKFIDQMSRWYVNLSKERFKTTKSTVPLDVLGNILYYFALVTAPFTPFMSEAIYQKLRPLLDTSSSSNSSTLEDSMVKDSIHLQNIPEETIWRSNGFLLYTFDHFAKVVDLVRVIRTKRSNTSAKLPLKCITITSKDKTLLESLEIVKSYVHEQLNIDNVKFSADLFDYVSMNLSPNIPKLKRRLTEGRDIGRIIKFFRTWNSADYRGGKVQIDGDLFVLKDEMLTTYEPKIDHVVCKDEVVIHYDDIVDEEMMDRYYFKLFNREYQDARKDARLTVKDAITLRYICKEEIGRIIEKYFPESENTNIVHGKYIIDENSENILLKKEINIEIGVVTLFLMKE